MQRIQIPEDALVILVAPSAAGKSTFARRHFRPLEIVSSDRCRALVSDDEADQTATAPAFEVFHAIIRGRLRLGRLSVADATNLDPGPRQRLGDMAREFARPVVAVVLEVSPERLAAQNLSRERRVPPHVLELHHARFEVARKALPAEAYDAIYEVQPASPFRVERTPARQSGAANLAESRVDRFPRR